MMNRLLENQKVAGEGVFMDKWVEKHAKRVLAKFLSLNTGKKIGVIMLIIAVVAIASAMLHHPSGPATYFILK